MTTKQPPRLFVGGLSGRIFVATRYRLAAGGGFIVDTKYDVTEDFEYIEAEREQERHAISEDE
jgi:hypothetical protein